MLVALAVPVAFSIFTLGILLNYFRDIEHTHLSEVSWRQAWANTWSTCMKFRLFLTSYIHHLLLSRNKPAYQKIEIQADSD